MKHKLCALVLAGALLALTGCQLAKPEKTDSELFGDRFAGVYAVYREESNWGSFWSSDNPLLTEMGEETIDTGKYGNIAFPKLVLLGEYDEEAREYVFPGLEGFSLFITHTVEADGWPSTACNSNMADSKFHTTVGDSASTEEMEGTLYIGPPLGAGPDWRENGNPDGVWTLYRVCQTEDGAVYLDGNGDSFGGPGGFSTTQTAAQKITIGDEVTEETVSVTVHVETAPRLTRLTVTQFDENNQILKTEDPPLREDLPEIDCLPDAAWVLVEEESIGGVVRTLYNVPAAEEEPVCHQVILLDDSGMGCPAQLTIKR